MEMMIKIFIFLFLLALMAYEVYGKDRGALIITLAGNHKLSEYFEWSCRSIGSSAGFFDMIVFHEGNTVLKNVHCAKNVKFVDLGSNGLSKLIVDEITRASNTSESSRIELITLLSDIITHIPRYLVEPKPMFGTIFKEYLTSYSHWSYADPDIVWGNLCDWIDPQDLLSFDLITLAKTFDAGRLFIRGQFALHKNIPKMNNIWRGLDYLHIQNFASRVGGAARMVREKRKSEEIFGAFFKSAEGFYSQLVFQAGVSVKIVGRGVDDYSRDPVVVAYGKLYRCGMGELSTCLPKILSDPSNVTIATLPPIKLIAATAYHDKSICRMQWLPSPTRYCIATQAYAREGGVDSKLKLLHIGESVLEGGQWAVNDESSALRQALTVSAFFHFRHWDDYASLSMSTSWGTGEGSDKSLSGDELIGCMVLYLRPDGAMAFEACSIALSTVRMSLARGDRVKSLREIEAERGMVEARRNREGGHGSRRRHRGRGGGGTAKGGLDSVLNAVKGRVEPETRKHMHDYVAGVDVRKLKRNVT